MSAAPTVARADGSGAAHRAAIFRLSSPLIKRAACRCLDRCAPLLEWLVAFHRRRGVKIGERVDLRCSRHLPACERR